MESIGGLFSSPRHYHHHQHRPLLPQVLLLACGHTRGACTCLCISNHSQGSCSSGAYKIWCMNKREALKLLQELVDHSSNQSLTCSHPESSHVSRDSESQVGFQDFISELLSDSLLGTRAYTGNQHKVVDGRTRCCLALNRTVYIGAH